MLDHYDLTHDTQTEYSKPDQRPPEADYPACIRQSYERLNHSADAEYGDVPTCGSLYPCLLKHYEDVPVLTSQRI